VAEHSTGPRRLQTGVPDRFSPIKPTAMTP
jgi:hypothetical protein